MLATPHYRLYSTIEDARLESRTPRFLEFALRHYTRALARLEPPTQPMETYILGSRPQWQAITRSITGRNAPTYLRIQRGGYALGGKGVFWDIGPSDTLQLAAHEGWHQFTQAAFASPLPSWLEEGIACYMEGFGWHDSIPDTPSFLPWRNIERFDRLRGAHARGELISLDELVTSRLVDLVNTTGAAALDYYAQVWALVHFLRDGDNGRYRAALAALLRDAEAGTLYGNVAREVGPDAARRAMLTRRGPEVFRAYFTDDLDAADRVYRRFIEAIVQTGGRDAIVAGRSPLDPIRSTRSARPD